MAAEVTRLLDSLRRVLWKNGNIPGERLRHDVDVNGNHTFALQLRRDEITDDRPVRAKPLTMGPTTPGKPLAKT
jgi:hypothetical protein